MDANPLLAVDVKLLQLQAVVVSPLLIVDVEANSRFAVVFVESCPAEDATMVAKTPVAQRVAQAVETEPFSTTWATLLNLLLPSKLHLQSTRLLHLLPFQRPMALTTVADHHRLTQVLLFSEASSQSIESSNLSGEHSTLSFQSRRLR